MIADPVLPLRRLWQEVFEDTDTFADAFFAVGYSPDRSHCILEDGVPVSALYWFDCHLGGHKLAYLYGVATRKSHRGQGFARCLMNQTHEILRSRGYSGVILVPEKAQLFDFYKKMGYRTAGTVAEFSCSQGDVPTPVQEIGANEYARLRKKYLPAGGVVQEGETLTFLKSYARFYAGADFLLVGEMEGGDLVSQELLGNAAAAPGILKALNIPRGHFRTPGTERDFAMFLPLDNCPLPTYFGLALD